MSQWIVLIAVLAVLVLILSRFGGLDALLAALFQRKPARLPYESRGMLLSKNEAAFYHGLRRVVADRYAIAMKVRLADILKCDREAWKAGYGNRIISKHVDFVLVDQDSTAFIAAIEIDDNSHQRNDRRTRDEFLNDALAAAEIPLIRFPARNRYDVRTIEHTLNESLQPSKQPQPDATAERRSSIPAHA